VDNSEIVEAVICDVGEGHHLKTFPDKKVLWDACMHNDAFKTFVSLVFNKWMSCTAMLQGERKLRQSPS